MKTRVTVVYYTDIVYPTDGPPRRSYWARSAQLAGWSAADDDLGALMAKVIEGAVLVSGDQEVDVRHRWASDPSGTIPVIATTITTVPGETAE